MIDQRPKPLTAVIPAIVAALPQTAPGLSLRQIHAKLGDVPFVARSLRPVLDQLEREGRAMSQLGIGDRRRETRLYRRTDATP